MGDVGGNDDRSFVTGGGDFPGENVEKFAAAGGESKVGTGGGELEGEFFANTGGGAGDEDGLGMKERVGHGGDSVTETGGQKGKCKGERGRAKTTTERAEGRRREQRSPGGGSVE